MEKCDQAVMDFLVAMDFSKFLLRRVEMRPAALLSFSLSLLYLSFSFVVFSALVNLLLFP
jgi:hypothetical protein